MSRVLRDPGPTRNYGKTFRVNYKCPNCGVHIRVPVEGYGRNGWNCRRFTCVKCHQSYTMHIATTVHTTPANPPVGTGTRRWLKDARKVFKEDVDHLDLVFFNGHAFRPLLASFLRDLSRTVEGIRRKVPGFDLLFPKESISLQALEAAAAEASKSCLTQFQRDDGETWSAL